MTNYLDISPNYQSQYDRTQLMKPVSDDNYPYTKILDSLDERVLNTVKNSPVSTSIIWDSTPITTISYRFYGTTTLFYAILMYNGYLHEHDIPRGAEIKIPVIDNNKFKNTIKKPMVLKGV
jgi:hypothetical protein